MCFRLWAMFFWHKAIRQPVWMSFICFFSNLTAVEYVRNFMKRVRKRFCSYHSQPEPSRILIWMAWGSIPSRCFPSPTHQFLFNAGSLMPSFIRIPCNWRIVSITWSGIHNGESACIKCGNERYNLMVKCPGTQSQTVRKGRRTLKGETMNGVKRSRNLALRLRWPALPVRKRLR